MLGKLALLLQGKAAVAAVGTVMVVGGGGTAMVATGQVAPLSALVGVSATVSPTVVASPSGELSSVAVVPVLATPQASPEATDEATPEATSQPEESREVVGMLLAYDAATHVLSVQVAGQTQPVSVQASNATKVDGEHAIASADLSAAVGHQVTVHVAAQPDGTLLALHISVTGSEHQQDQSSGEEGKTQQESQTPEHEQHSADSDEGSDSHESSVSVTATPSVTPATSSATPTATPQGDHGDD